jgi:hypothetical protein
MSLALPYPRDFRIFPGRSKRMIVRPSAVVRGAVFQACP